MDAFLRFFTPGVLFLITLGFGFWFSRLGKPYNGFLFNVHKLIALSGVVTTIIQLTKATNNAGSLLLIILLIIAALCVVALFASGAFMSANQLDYTLMLTIHRISPALLTFTMALVVYLLGRKL